MTEPTRAPAPISRPVTRVLLVLPPDFHAPPSNLEQRFPPLGPAVVAAAIAPLGMTARAVDLAALLHRRPPRHDPAPLDDPDALDAHLAGRTDAALGGLVEELFAHLDPYRSECDVVALSVDRGSQVPVAALLGREIKRRWGCRIIAGGVSTDHLRAVIDRAGAPSIDVLTHASTPEQIRVVFAALLDLPAHRAGPPLNPSTEIVELIRGGLRKAASAAGWPLPDFGIYDLDLYRRPLLDDRFGGAHPEARALAPHLVLPYHFAFECQFACAFCQTGGNQEAKPVDQVVRELAALAERWGVRDFLFFNAQSNLLAPDLARALLAARLDLRWSDSYRVRPSEPGDLELMARAGCASLTVGVESASDKVLKAMVKGHRAEQATETVREAHRCEILLRVNILTCYPGETEDDLALTCRWLEENAFAIDDLAPSSFYLTADSPIGRNLARHGLVSRGPRALHGVTKFRKSPDSLAYDEVGGLRWEEREPLLAESEERVRRAWLAGRAAVGRPSGFAPAPMLGLRRRFATKDEMYATLRRWQGSAALAAPPASLPVETGAPDTVRLGATSLRVKAIGVGTWAWGERPYWGYDPERGARDVVDAFTTSVDAGLDLFDTAEVYAHGDSEKMLGWMVRKRGAPLVVATKFALLPGRPGARALARALDHSLRRLGLPRVDLYQIHWADTAMASIASLMEAMADAVESGKIGAVGVSNFSATEMRAAHAALARRGVPLATNQVHYSLLHRAPEVDGVLDACRELGVTLLAYSPLEQGVLTGKYAPGRVPAGPRAALPSFQADNLAAAGAVVDALRAIGAAHGGKPPEQVALNWLRARAVLPIPGARSGAQAASNAGALSFTLTDAEVEALDQASDRWKRA
jgi:aryl-alcohol dehydrogenase-like predicted oxidoreductase